MKPFRLLATCLFAFTLCGVWACSDDDDDNTSTGTENDTSDSTTNTETGDDSDSNDGTDIDSETQIDTDSSIATDNATDSDTNTDTNTGTDTDSGSDSDSAQPSFCPALTGEPGPEGPTYIDGSDHSALITADTTWTAAKSPYVITDSSVYVQGTGTNTPVLSIEACTMVQFADDLELFVGQTEMGAIRVMGDENEPVVFTSLKDPPEAGNWNGIYIGEHAASNSELRNARIEFAGSDFASSDAALYVGGSGTSGPTVLLDHVTIENNAMDGLKVADGAKLHPDSANLQIHNNGKYGVNIEPLPLATLPGIDRGSSYDKNGTEGVHLYWGHQYYIKEDITWPRLDQPIITDDEDIYIDENGCLTVPAGTEWRFAEGRGIYVGSLSAGCLKLQGEDGNPVTLTSVKDSPAPGDWEQVVFGENAGQENEMRHVRLEYSGGTHTTHAALLVQGSGKNGPMLLLDNVAIVDNDAHGLIIRDGAELHPDSTNLVITDNTGYGADIEPAAMHTLPGTDKASSYGGNGTEGIHLHWGHGYDITEDVAWSPFDQPIVQTEGDNVIDIHQGGCLSLSAGTEWRFGPESLIRVGKDGSAGCLVAVGNPAQPETKIVFTTAAPTPGESKGLWEGIFLESGTTARTQLTFVEIGYSGADFSWTDSGGADVCTPINAPHEGMAALHNYSPQLAGETFLTHSEIHHSGGYAVICAVGDCVDLGNAAHNNSFHDNVEGVADCH